jgi:hypothetical protein
MPVLGSKIMERWVMTTVVQPDRRESLGTGLLGLGYRLTDGLELVLLSSGRGKLGDDPDRHWGFVLRRDGSRLPQTEQAIAADAQASSLLGVQSFGADSVLTVREGDLAVVLAVLVGWLSATAPEPLLEFLRDRASERKLRLFACECCRRIWTALKRRGSRKAVEVCERYADALATSEELRSAHESAQEAFARVQWAAESDVETTPARAAIRLGCGADFNAAWAADEAASTFGVRARERAYNRRRRDAAKGQGEEPVWEQHDSTYRSAQVAEKGHQTRLLRCIFGNPFRLVSIDPGWRTETVVALAQGIYQDRAFDRLPVLADSLEEAGCDHSDILTHCRGEGPHARGCWVVDLLLGKN